MMAMPRVVHRQCLGWLGVLVFVVGCAQPIAPTGGPEDRTPLRLIGSSPEVGAVSVETDATIYLLFNKEPQLSSLRSGLSLYPSAGALEILVRRNQAIVRPSAPLMEQVTYRLTLSDALRDVRGNALAIPTFVTFSTGAVIDTNRIAGQLLRVSSGEPFEGANLTFYPDSTETASLPVPWVRTDADGRFDLPNMPSGAFRAIDFVDVNRNGIQEEAEYKIAWRADGEDAQERLGWVMDDPMDLWSNQPPDSAAAFLEGVARTLPSDRARLMDGNLPATWIVWGAVEDSSRVVVRASPEGRFRLRVNALIRAHHLRAFQDLDGDSTWDVRQPAEPIGWLAVGEPLRPGWTTALADTLILRAPSR